jgi:hypothetical protein
MMSPVGTSYILMFRSRGVFDERFIEGEDRSQSTLFPECLEDYVSEDNPIRAIEAFVEELNLGDLGFDGTEPEVTGRPVASGSMPLKPSTPKSSSSTKASTTRTGLSSQM